MKKMTSEVLQKFWERCLLLVVKLIWSGGGEKQLVLLHTVSIKS